MKQIIRGKRYDTDTAKEMGSTYYSNPSDFNYWEETLYRKQTGEFFLYGEGGPATKYAVSIGQNQWSGGWKILPLTPENAAAWAEENLSADKYEEIFGVVEDDGEKKIATFSLSTAAIEKLRNAAAKRGATMSGIIEDLIATL